jgi:hypothetical protein
LNISRYVDLIRYAWNNKLIIEGIPLTRPAFLAINVLPWDHRQTLIPKLAELQQEIASTITVNTIQNGRNLGNLAQKLSRECQAMISMLQQPTPVNVDELRQELINHCEFWDRQYNLNIGDIAELALIFREWGYGL